MCEQLLQAATPIQNSKIFPVKALEQVCTSYATKSMQRTFILKWQHETKQKSYHVYYLIFFAKKMSEPVVKIRGW